MTFVLDASVTLAWLFPDERDPYPNRILDRLEHEPALVSSIWPLEVANGLVIAERRGRVTVAEAPVVAARLQALPITIDLLSLDAALGPVVALARTYKLTAYDASYLELAVREGLALATIDRPMRTAAQSAGVPIAE